MAHAHNTVTQVSPPPQMPFCLLSQGHISACLLSTPTSFCDCLPFCTQLSRRFASHAKCMTTFP